MISSFIPLGFVMAGAITGYLSHSMAFMSDAGHNFADALAL
jgi:Co/Zn/Cd efflux system component